MPTILPKHIKPEYINQKSNNNYNKNLSIVAGHKLPLSESQKSHNKDEAT